MAVRPDASTKSAAGKPLEEDLEQYGVWVKAEPRDIVEETDAVSPSFPDSKELGDLDLPKEEDFLSEDEEKFLGSFEEIEVEEEKKDMAAGKNEAEEMPDIDNLPPLEDFAIKEETMNDIEDLGASTIDISLDELEKEAEIPSPIRPDAEIDISTIRGLSHDEAVEEKPAPSSAPIIEDVSAEFLDFIEEPSETPAGTVAADQGSFPEAEPHELSEPQAEPEFEPIDMDLHFDDTIPSGSERPGSALGAEPGFEEVSEFDDFLKEAPARPGFDDLSAVEKELSSEAPAAEEAAPADRKAAAAAEPSHAEGSGNASLSNELLLKIAEELSSIRGELVTLKGQISSFKKEESFIPPAAAEEETPELAPAAPSRSMGGFFDDEEDETIALTGDELDNILNTADFTEEPVEEEGESLEPGPDFPSLDNILPESGDYSAPKAEEGFGEEAAIEEIRLEPAGEAALPSFEEEKEERIGTVADEGVSHLTQAPDDTSYLEEPLPDEEALDLSEPELVQESLAESEALDLKLEEEAESNLDISEELPVVEGRPEAEALDDLTLGAKAKEDYLPVGVDEALPVEAVPEFEESDFGEINLTIEEEAEVNEEIEEIKLAEEEGGAAPLEDVLPDFEEEIEEKTVKPAEPVALHPDELPTSLDDSFFLSPIEESEKIEEAEQEAPSPLASSQQTPAESSPKVAPAPALASADSRESKDDRLRGEIKSVLSYLDKLLESLPEDKIEEFARSEYFDTYKKLFEELGLV